MSRNELKGYLRHSTSVSEKFIADFLKELGVDDNITENPLCRYELRIFAIKYLKRQALLDDNDKFENEKLEEVKDRLKTVFGLDKTGTLKLIDCYIADDYEKHENITYKYNDTTKSISINEKNYKIPTKNDLSKPTIEDIDRMVDEKGIETYRKVLEGDMYGVQTKTEIKPDEKNYGLLNVTYNPNYKKYYSPNENLPPYMNINFKASRDWQHPNRLLLKHDYLAELKNAIEENPFPSFIEQRMRKSYPDEYSEDNAKEFTAKSLAKILAKRFSGIQCPGPDRHGIMEAAIESILKDQGIINKDELQPVA